MNGNDINTSLRKITYLSVFVALSVIINVLRIGKISFGGFPIILSGYMLGPVWGFAVGFVADIVSFLLRPSGDFNPVFSLTSGLTGFIPVFLTIVMGDKYPKYKVWKVLISIAIGQLVTSVLMVPFFLNFFYKKNLYQSMISAGSKQLYSVPIYAVLTSATVKSVSFAVDFSFFNKD